MYQIIFNLHLTADVTVCPKLYLHLKAALCRKLQLLSLHLTVDVIVCLKLHLYLKGYVFEIAIATTVFTFNSWRYCISKIILIFKKLSYCMSKITIPITVKLKCATAYHFLGGAEVLALVRLW